MAKEKAVKPAVTEYNVFVNDKPMATHADLATAHRLAQHYFSDEIYNGSPAPVVRIQKRVVEGDDVTEEDI